MHTGSEFIKTLREEILKAQDRRNSYVKQKLGFAVALLGVGSASIYGNIVGVDADTSVLLYLVPLTAFVFDLYIFGEDFGIKRVGIFIKNSQSARLEEVVWETFVEGNRDWFSFLAGPLSSVLIFAASAFVLSISDFPPYYTLWFILGLSFSLFGLLYVPIRWVLTRNYGVKIADIQKSLTQKGGRDQT